MCSRFVRRRTPTCIAAVAILAWPAVCAGQALPFVVTACVRTDAPPVIDGRLDEACWQTTRPMRPFVKLTLGSSASEQSTGYLLHDSQNLYLGVRCEESQMDAVKAEVTKRDGPVFGDDSIEIFLIPPDSTVLAPYEERVRYFHLCVNTLAARYDEIGLEAPGTFDGEWQAAVHKGANGWELEVAVPFAELGAKPDEGAVWTGNISRARWHPKEYSSWSPIKRTFHDTKNFGRFVFTRDLASVEERLGEIELAAVRSGLLAPAAEAIDESVRAVQETIPELPGNCRRRIERAARTMQVRLDGLRGDVDALTVDNFRADWRALQYRAGFVAYDADELRDEAVMLAATEGGTRPWHVMVTKAMTNERLLSNRWPRDVTTLPRLAMAACRGEYESATFSLYAVRDLKGVRLAFSDLRSGGNTLPASCLDPYVVKCWYQAGRGIGDLGHKLLTPELLLKDDKLVKVDHRERRNFVRARPGSSEYLDVTLTDSSNLKDLVPRDADELLPVDVPSRTLKQFWVTAQIPMDAAPGKYVGTITLSATGESPTRLPIEVTVLPFELAEPMLEYSLYYRGVITAGGSPSISSEGKSRGPHGQYAAEMRDLVAHGVTNPTLYQSYDETLLNEVFDLREAAGMKGKPVMTLGTGTGAPQTQAELDALKQRVKQWLDFIRARGYTELYVYGIDEASGEALKAERAAFQAVHEAGAKVFVACYKDYFESVGDLLDLPVWSGRPDPEEARKAHSVGHRIFNYGHPQCGVEEPETYRRNFGLLLWKCGYDGAMDYAYQHSFGHEWNDFDSPSYRDHTMAYPTANGVIDTIQWEGFREAVDDVRYLTTLLEAVEAAKAEGGGKARLADATEKWIASIDPDGDLDAIRQEMVRRIVTLGP